MHQFAKHFTLAEARALLPDLRHALHDINRRRDRLAKTDAQLAKRQATTGDDLGGPTVNSLITDLFEVNAHLKRITDQGILLKDLDRGLVDFPHLRGEQEVLLCWELDEDDIEFWHDIDSGYSGRERL